MIFELLFAMFTSKRRIRSYDEVVDRWWSVSHKQRRAKTRTLSESANQQDTHCLCDMLGRLVSQVSRWIFTCSTLSCVGAKNTDESREIMIGFQVFVWSGAPTMKPVCSEVEKAAQYAGDKKKLAKLRLVLCLSWTCSLYRHLHFQ